METANKNTNGRTGISFSHPREGLFLVRLSGVWQIGEDLPPVDRVQEEIDSGTPTRIMGFDTRKLTGWDRGLLTFLIKVNHLCTRTNIRFDGKGHPGR